MNAFSRKSLSAQVQEVLAQKIVEGSWRPGFAIPNEIDLAKSYGVSVGTMRKALSGLEEEGLIIRRQGRGSYVSEPSPSALRARFEHLVLDTDEKPTPSIRQLGCTEHLATSEECEHLQLTTEDSVVVCRQLVQMADTSTLYREARFSRKLYPEFDCAEAWDVFKASNRLGLRINTGVEKLSLRHPPAHVAKALGIKDAVTLAEISRIVMALDGRPLEWLLSWSELQGLHYQTLLR